MDFETFIPSEPLEFTQLVPPEPLGCTQRLRDSVPEQVGDPSYQPSSPFNLPGGVEIRRDKLVEPDLPPRLKALQTAPQAVKLNPCILIARRCSRITPQFEMPGKSAYAPGLPISDFACPLCSHTHYFVEPPAEPEPVPDKALDSSKLQSAASEDALLEGNSLGINSPGNGLDEEGSDKECSDEDDSEDEGSVNASAANEEVEAPIERCDACNLVTMKFVSC